MKQAESVLVIKNTRLFPWNPNENSSADMRSISKSLIFVNKRLKSCHKAADKSAAELHHDLQIKIRAVTFRNQAQLWEVGGGRHQWFPSAAWGAATPTHPPSIHTSEINPQQSEAASGLNVAQSQEENNTAIRKSVTLPEHTVEPIRQLPPWWNFLVCSKTHRF